MNQIIRDHDTQASLGYAFIEFESDQQAVEAYLKMNNVLIDDRRIKVDFSQSVAKLWNKRRRGERLKSLNNYSRMSTKVCNHQQNSITHPSRDIEIDLEIDLENDLEITEITEIIEIMDIIDIIIEIDQEVEIDIDILVFV